MRADLEELADYIAQDDLDAAMRTLGDFRAEMERLADMPQLGHLRRDLADEDIRFWPVHSYLIIYRPETQPLQIIRVLRGFRDVANLPTEE